MSLGLLACGHRKRAEPGPCCTSSVHLYIKYEVRIARYKGQAMKCRAVNAECKSVCSLEAVYCDLFPIRIELDLEPMRI